MPPIAAPTAPVYLIAGRACILGPASTMPEEAKALAVLINAFGLGSEKARLLLKGMHEANAV